VCRACSSDLAVTFADLGIQPPSNAYLNSIADVDSERLYPLRAKVCGTCNLVQVDYDVPPRELFHNYAYFSSYSEGWLNHARGYCDMVSKRLSLDKQSLVVELASNDGYLLKNFVEHGIPVLGIDPSDTVAAAAEKIGVPTLVEFFGKEVAARLVREGKSADLIVANNVLAHVPALNDFVTGISTLLRPGGTVTIEFPHLLKLIEHVEFDTIYHEHFSYISLLAIEKVLGQHGLCLYDVEELPTHGGSLRIFASHIDFIGTPDSESLRKVRRDEAAAGLDRLETYSRFSAQVEICRKSLLAFLAQTRRDGKVVIGYGAAAKGNTLLNFCSIRRDDIPYVADRNPHKQGKLLPGSHIPIVSPTKLSELRPDYVLILPWNIKDEVMVQLDEVRSWGGRFVTAIPTIQIYG
jgi:SAM-dependent methyltransferase